MVTRHVYLLFALYILFLPVIIRLILPTMFWSDSTLMALAGVMLVVGYIYLGIVKFGPLVRSWFTRL